MEKSEKEEMKPEAKAIVIFPLVMDTMKAQAILKKAGYYADAVVPPDEMCECCELGLMVGQAEQHAIEKVLKENGLRDYRILQLAP